MIIGSRFSAPARRRMDSASAPSQSMISSAAVSTTSRVILPSPPASAARTVRSPGEDVIAVAPQLSAADNDLLSHIYGAGPSYLGTSRVGLHRMARHNIAGLPRSSPPCAAGPPRPGAPGM